MDGKERVERAYKEGKYKFCGRCRTKTKHLFMKGHYLDVNEARDPSLILWENLGTSKIDRTFRVGFTTILGFILLVITASINLWGASVDKTVQEFSPQIDCSATSDITAADALADYQRGDQQQGKMYCYCYNEFIDTQTVDTEFEVRVPGTANQFTSEYYCEDWLVSYSTS